MSATTEAMSLPVPLRRNRVFQLILTGQTISILGDGFHSVALAIWVLQATGSAKAMSAVMGVKIVVSILLGTIGGTLADRSDRRMLMWTMDLLRGVMVLGMAFLIQSPAVPFWLILASTGLVAVASQLRNPAFNASLVNIVGNDHVQKAGSTLQLTSQIARVAGPLLGGVWVAAFGGWSGLMLDGASFVFCAVCVLLAGSFPSPVRTGRQKRSFWNDLTEGLGFIGKDPLVLAITILAPCLNFFGNAYAVLVPVLAIKVWQVEAGTFGALEAAFPLGMALGAGILTILRKRLRHRGLLIGGGMALTGPLVALVGLMPSVVPALPVALALGAVFSFANTIIALTLQGEIAPEMQGRVWGSLGALVNVATPLSIGAAGLLADSVGVVPVIVAAGACLLATGLIGTLLPGLRQLD